jgi:hypothetical protein
MSGNIPPPALVPNGVHVDITVTLQQIKEIKIFNYRPRQVLSVPRSQGYEISRQ